MISIHALLAESDSSNRITTQTARHFNPRSPCGERLVCHLPIPFVMGISIHALLAESDRVDLFPAPRAAISIHALLAESDGLLSVPQLSSMDFNPRSPCGERPKDAAVAAQSAADFNPRSPCGERPVSTRGMSVPSVFQSTLSLRRATGGSH